MAYACMVCTLIIATQVWPQLPLLVAGNRDERLTRPSRPPAPWPGGVIAPRDEEAGGTWIGSNREGVIAAVTNRFGGQHEPSRGSRGALVPAALAATSAEEAAHQMASLEATDFNPFHLVVADRKTAWVIRPVAGRLELGPLSAGIHVVTERSFRADRSGREDALRRSVADWMGGEPPTNPAIEGLLGEHHDRPFDGVCVHMPEIGYGTRSSSILRLGATGRPAWRFAEGPPCMTEYEDVAVP